MKRLFNVAVTAIVIDQLLKILIQVYFKVGESLTIINNFFRITYAQNIGAAWSILSGDRFLLIIIALFVLGLIYFFFLRNKTLKKSESIIYGILVGGVIGNLIDRIVYGYVIDYIDIKIFSYNYPIFNFADICIVISVFILIFMTLKGDKNASK